LQAAREGTQFAKDHVFRRGRGNRGRERSNRRVLDQLLFGVGDSKARKAAERPLDRALSRGSPSCRQPFSEAVADGKQRSLIPDVCR